MLSEIRPCLSGIRTTPDRQVLHALSILRVLPGSGPQIERVVAGAAWLALQFDGRDAARCPVTSRVGWQLRVQDHVVTPPCYRALAFGAGLLLKPALCATPRTRPTVSKISVRTSPSACLDEPAGCCSPTLTTAVRHHRCARHSWVVTTGRCRRESS